MPVDLLSASGNPARLAVQCGVRTLTGLLLAAALWLPGHDAGAATPQRHTLEAGDHPRSQAREYKVYVPDGLTGPAPLVMVLHGCEQTHDDVLGHWGLTAAADRHRFILVAPFITRYDGWRYENCWGFWIPQHRHQGHGEAEDLVRIAREVEKRHPVDPRRRYVAGLSSGGAMAVVLSVTHNEYFAAVASVAGLPYGETSDAVSTRDTACPAGSVRRDPPDPSQPGRVRFLPLETVVSTMRSERDAARRVPLLVVQNLNDCTVLAKAAELIRDAQFALDGAPGHATADAARAREQPCAAVFEHAFDCRHTYYTVDARPGSRSIVETVFYAGPIETSHAYDRDRGHYWVGGAAGREWRYAVREGPSHPDLLWEFFARHPADPEQAQPAAPVITCAAESSSPLGHVAAGRAEVDGFAWFGRARATGDWVDIGYAWNWMLAQRVLYQGKGGLWYSRPPAGCR